MRIDRERRIIHAEAGVTMEALVRTAREYGLVPKVVAPFRKATVGGAVSGQKERESSDRVPPLTSSSPSCSLLGIRLRRLEQLAPPRFFSRQLQLPDRHFGEWKCGHVLQERQCGIV